MRNILTRYKAAIFALVRYEVDVASTTVQGANELACRAVEMGMSPGEIVAIHSVTLQGGKGKDEEESDRKGK